MEGENHEQALPEEDLDRQGDTKPEGFTSSPSPSASSSASDAEEEASKTAKESKQEHNGSDCEAAKIKMTEGVVDDGGEEAERKEEAPSSPMDHPLAYNSANEIADDAMAGLSAMGGALRAVLSDDHSEADVTSPSFDSEPVLNTSGHALQASMTSSLATVVANLRASSTLMELRTCGRHVLESMQLNAEERSTLSQVYDEHRIHLKKVERSVLNSCSLHSRLLSESSGRTP